MRKPFSALSRRPESQVTGTMGHPRLIVRLCLSRAFPKDGVEFGIRMSFVFQDISALPAWSPRAILDGRDPGGLGRGSQVSLSPGGTYEHFRQYRIGNFRA
jgi:hypothetical protein